MVDARGPASPPLRPSATDARIPVLNARLLR